MHLQFIILDIILIIDTKLEYINSTLHFSLILLCIRNVVSMYKNNNTCIVHEM